MPEVAWVAISGDACPSAPVELHTIAMRRDPNVADVVSFWRLFRFFRSRRFHLVQTHTPKASLLGLPAAKLAGHRTAYTIHGALLFVGNARVRNVAGWLFERWCCTWADKVLLQSAEDERNLTRTRCCSPSKLAYIGNGIDLERYAPVPLPEHDKPLVLMVSRLVAEKGCRDYFRLAAALQGAADFVHVGPIETDQKDAITPEEMGRATAAGVRFVGNVQDVRPYVADADVVVLPSYREGIPRAAMESAAMRRPVVAYDIRGVREVIPAGQGLLVPFRDVDALIERVRALLCDRGRRLAAGDACAEWVRARFSEDDVVARLRGIYARMLS